MATEARQSPQETLQRQDWTLRDVEIVYRFARRDGLSESEAAARIAERAHVDKITASQWVRAARQEGLI